MWHWRNQFVCVLFLHYCDKWRPTGQPVLSCRHTWMLVYVWVRIAQLLSWKRPHLWNILKVTAELIVSWGFNESCLQTSRDLLLNCVCSVCVLSVGRFCECLRVSLLCSLSLGSRQAWQSFLSRPCNLTALFLLHAAAFFAFLLYLLLFLAHPHWLLIRVWCSFSNLPIHVLISQSRRTFFAS